MKRFTVSKNLNFNLDNSGGIKMDPNKFNLYGLLLIHENTSTDTNHT